MALVFAGTGRDEHTDACEQTLLRDRQPTRGRRRSRLQLPMQFSRNHEQFLAQQWIGIGWQRSSKRFKFREIQVNVHQREQDGEDKERRAVQKQVVAPQQPGKDSRPLQRDEPQQWVSILDRVQTFEDDAAGCAQSKRKRQTVLDQRSKDGLHAMDHLHTLGSFLMRAALKTRLTSMPQPEQLYPETVLATVRWQVARPWLRQMPCTSGNLLPASVQSAAVH